MFRIGDCRYLQHAVLTLFNTTTPGGLDDGGLITQPRTRNMDPMCREQVSPYALTRGQWLATTSASTTSPEFGPASISAWMGPTLPDGICGMLAYSSSSGSSYMWKNIDCR